MHTTTPVWLAAFVSLASAQVIPIAGINFTITNFCEAEISQQAYDVVFDLALNDTVAGNVTVPGVSAHCEASYILTSHMTQILECDIQSPNPYHSIVATTGFGDEIWYYFYSPETSSSFVITASADLHDAYNACPRSQNAPIFEGYYVATCDVDVPAAAVATVPSCQDTESPCPPSPVAEPSWPPDPVTLTNYTWTIGNWTWVPGNGIAPYSFVVTGNYLQAGMDAEVIVGFQVKCDGTPYPAGTVPDTFRACEGVGSWPLYNNTVATWVVMPPAGSSQVQVGILLSITCGTSGSECNGNTTFSLISISEVTPTLNELTYVTVNPTLQPEAAAQSESVVYSRRLKGRAGGRMGTR